MSDTPTSSATAPPGASVAAPPQCTLDAIRDGVLVLDADDRVVAANRSFCDLWGLAPSSLVGADRRALQAMVIDRLADPVGFLRTVNGPAHDAAAITDDELRLRDGRVLARHAAPRIDGGRVTGRVLTFQDVTQRAQAELALTARARLGAAIARVAARLTDPAELELDTVLQDLGQAMAADRAWVFRVRDDGVLLDNTHEWCAPGIASHRDELQGIDGRHLPWWIGRMIAGDPVRLASLDLLPAEAEAERALLAAQGITALLAVPIASQQDGWLGFLGFDVCGAARAWTDDDVHALQTIADLLATELQRRAREAALATSETRLALVLDATTDGFWDWDLTSDRVVFSERWYRMIGYTPTAAADSSAWWFDLVHPDDRGDALHAMRRHLRGDTPSWESEQRVRDGAGAWRWILTRGRVVARDAEGRALRMVGTHTDVTDRRGLEEQLHQSQKMEAIGRLAGGVAHDFNNLLTAVLGHAQLLLRRLPAGERARTSADEIRKAAERAAALTQQLLAFSRKQVLQPRVLELSAVAADTEGMLRRLIGEDVELVTALTPANTRVKADPTQLQQVLMNLVVNARDAMPGGGRLLVETAASDVRQPIPATHGSVPPGRYVMLAVTDTGTGMDAATLGRIFEPFFTTKGVGRGTGLGLATVYGIVKQSGGHVWVYSEPQVGTTFRLYFPRVEDVPADDIFTPEESGELPSGRGRVLVVEDEPAVRELVVEVLTVSGYTVFAAASPHAALRYADDAEPASLLLSDVVMPGMNGRELAERLRARWPSCRVLLMSGYTGLPGVAEPEPEEARPTTAADGDPAPTARGRGAVAATATATWPLLAKPFTPQQLAESVRRVLEAPEAAWRTVGTVHA